MRLFRRRSQSPLRYYLYISDTKLDMLFDQIDPALRRRVSAEAKVDLKLASLTLRQADQPQATRMAKLRMVEHYIDTYHHVGTIREPGHAYFRGSMPMRWGWLINGRGIERPTGGRDTAFFRGQDGSDVVVLAGSRRHVLGEQPAAQDSSLSAHSATPTIMAVIAEHISGDPELGQWWRNLRQSGFTGSEEGAAAQDPPEVGLQAAAQVRLTGPAQRLEFLAVPLVEGDGIEIWIDYWPGPCVRETVHAVLATPLYVAMAGPATN